MNITGQLKTIEKLMSKGEVIIYENMLLAYEDKLIWIKNVKELKMIL